MPTEAAEATRPAAVWLTLGPWNLAGTLNRARVATTTASKGVLLTTSGEQVYRAGLSAISGGSSTQTKVPDGTWKTDEIDVSWIRKSVDLLRTSHLGHDGALRYQRSPDGGISWTSSFVLATGGASELRDAGIARSPGGTVAAAWWHGHSLKARVSSNGGTTWGPTTTIGSWQSSADQPGDMALEVASGTVVVAFWSDDTTLSVRRTKNAGATWKGGTLATGTRGPGLDIATAGNNVLAAFSSGTHLYTRLSSDFARTWQSTVTVGKAPSTLALGRSDTKWFLAQGNPASISVRTSGAGVTWTSAAKIYSSPGSNFAIQNVGAWGPAPLIAEIHEQSGHEKALALTWQ
jgi:hypothetical protein